MPIHTHCMPTGVCQWTTAGTAPMKVCSTDIQNISCVAVSVRVSDLTMVTETANPTAATSAIRCPTLKAAPGAGRTMSTTPATPSAMAAALRASSRSPRKA